MSHEPSLPSPLVSVCIANYNGMEILDECLCSVMKQQGNTPLEILVHDDASTDDSVAHIGKNYPEVLLMASAENVGFCVANNRMVARARGQFVLLLNNDATLHPNAIQTLLEGAKRLGRPAILTLPQYDATSGELVDRGCLLDPFFNPVPNLDPKRIDVAMVIGACLWIPKNLWDELEGFPEWFGSIAEDMYLCCRARLAGYLVRALQESGYCHWQGKSFGGSRIVNNRLSTTIRRRSFSERNKTFAMYVTCPAPLFYFILPIHIALLLIEGTVLTFSRRQGTILQLIYLAVFNELWRERARLTRLRSLIQGSRCVATLTYFEVFSWLPHKLTLLIKHGIPKIR